MVPHRVAERFRVGKVSRGSVKIDKSRRPDIKWRKSVGYLTRRFRRVALQRDECKSHPIEKCFLPFYSCDVILKKFFATKTLSLIYTASM